MCGTARSVGSAGSGDDMKAIAQDVYGCAEVLEYALAEAPDAIRYLAQGRSAGKVVGTVSS
jgi:hypothetical protein